MENYLHTLFIFLFILTGSFASVGIYPNVFLWEAREIAGLGNLQLFVQNVTLWT